MHTPVLEKVCDAVLGNTFYIQMFSIIYAILFICSLRIFAVSLYLFSRQPQFDPAVFSVWCTIIHPSLYSACRTLPSLCYSHSLVCCSSITGIFLSCLHSFFVSCSSPQSLYSLCCLHSVLCCLSLNLSFSVLSFSCLSFCL